VEFVCGGRLLRTLRTDHQTLKQLGKTYSGHIYELPRLAEKTLQDRAALARENARLREEVLEVEARELILSGEPALDFVVVKKIFSGRSLEGVKVLAQKLTEQGRAVAIFGLDQEPAHAVLARSSNVEGDCDAAVKKITAEHGGRGGGRSELAQAGGIAATSLGRWLAAAESYFRK